MAPLPATEWARPCQNVFEWKIQTEKFPPPPFSPRLLSSSRSSLFFSLTPSFSLFLHLPSPGLSILHRTQKGHLILSSGALTECCLCSEKNTLLASLSLPLSLWSPARALCLGEVSASHSEVHSSLKHDVYLLGPVCRTVQVSVPLSGAIMIHVAPLAKKTKPGEMNQIDIN